MPLCQVGSLAESWSKILGNIVFSWRCRAVNALSMLLYLFSYGTAQRANTFCGFCFPRHILRELIILANPFSHEAYSSLGFGEFIVCFRDGTLKSYSCSYPTSVQPAYSAVIQVLYGIILISLWFISFVRLVIALERE